MANTAQPRKTFLVTLSVLDQRNTEAGAVSKTVEIQALSPAEAGQTAQRAHSGMGFTVTSLAVAIKPDGAAPPKPAKK